MSFYNINLKKIIFSILFMIITLLSQFTVILSPFFIKSIKNGSQIRDNKEIFKRDLPYNPLYGNFTYIDNVNQTEYFFNAKGACYVITEVENAGYTSLKLDNEIINVSYGSNIIPIDFGDSFTFHNLTLDQSDVDNCTFKWIAVEPLVIYEGVIDVNLSEYYLSYFNAYGPISILIQPNFSYNWLYLEIDGLIVNDIYNTSDYPEIDSAFYSYIKNQGPYLRFDFNVETFNHTLKIMGNGSLDYKIIVNYDWDLDELDDVEEIQKELIYNQLAPTKPNVWGFFEKTPDFYYTYNKSGKVSGYFHFYIPETYNGSNYLYISVDMGEVSGIIVDEDDITLEHIMLSSNKLSPYSKETPYGVLDAGFHLIYFEYDANQSLEISFYIDNKEIIILDKVEFKDSDADGIKDYTEQENGLDIYDIDTDQDGLPDNMDHSPLTFLSFHGHRIRQIVIPHNTSKNTIVEMTIKKPDPDYASLKTLLWKDHPNSSGGLEVIIQPALRLFGNQSISRNNLSTFWKQKSTVDCFNLVDTYDPTSFGDAIPDPGNPNAEFMFVNPKASNQTYEFNFYYPIGHPAKSDDVIDIRFDFVWLVMYYNTTRDIRLMRYYKFDSDIILQSMRVQEIGEVNYILASPDSMIENQILWTLNQNPDLGSFAKYNVDDDVVGTGTVNFFDLVNQTLNDRDNNPISPNDTEVLYVSGLESSCDLLNKINLKNKGDSSFEVNHSGDIISYISFYTINDVYEDGLYEYGDDEITGETKICYVISWHNYSELGNSNTEQRANLLGYPIIMNVSNFQDYKVLEITRTIGSEIPLSNISYTLGSKIDERIVFMNQTYIEKVQNIVGIPTVKFDDDKHIYKELIDNRHLDIEVSKLIFNDYGIPISKKINDSFYKLKEAGIDFLNYSNNFPLLDNFFNHNFNNMWNKYFPTSERIHLFYLFDTLINEFPDYLIKKSQSMGNILDIKTEFDEILSKRQTYISFENSFSRDIFSLMIDSVFEASKTKSLYKKVQLKSPIDYKFKKDSFYYKFSALGTFVFDYYTVLFSYIEFFGTILPSLETSDNLMEYIGRLGISLGEVAIDTMDFVYGVLKAFPNEILTSKTLTTLSKWSGKITLIITVAIAVVELIFYDIPFLFDIMETEGFSVQFFIQITKIVLKVTGVILIPIILAATGSTGYGIIVGIIASVIILIIDWIFFWNKQEKEVITYSPHLQISTDKTNISFYDSTRDNFKRNGGLSVYDMVNLQLKIINDGNTPLYYYISTGFLLPNGSVHWWDDLGMYEPYGELTGYLDIGSSKSLYFDNIYNPETSTDATLVVNISTECNIPPYSGDWMSLYNFSHKIPLGLPILPYDIATFYNMTSELNPINYNQLKTSINESIAEYQYKDATDNLDKLRHRLSYDFLEESGGAAPTNWTDFSTSTCSARIVSEKEGHSKVLHLHDDATDGSAKIRTNFDNQFFGNVEFWLYKESGNSDLEVTLMNRFTLNRNFKIIFGNDSNIYYNQKDYNQTLARNLFYEKNWYHIIIHFFPNTSTTYGY
ncbi:MAG: hypothetical protein EU548_03395, partial [Promethearchaeota archaeon]